MPVALGGVASWLLVNAQSTNLAMKKMPRKVWKPIHMLSFGIWPLVAFHMVFAGTDSANTLMVGWFNLLASSRLTAIPGAGRRTLL